MTSIMPSPADRPVSKPIVLSLLLLLAAATVSAQVPTNPSQLPANLGPTLCPPSSVNPCAALGALPPISTAIPPAPTQPPCPPLPVNPCTVTNIFGCLPQPFVLNDCFSIPTLVARSPYNATQKLTGATYETGEKPDACIPANTFGVTGGGSVWYRWTPNQSGQAIVAAKPTNKDPNGFDPAVVVYSGDDISKLKRLGCNGAKAGAYAWGATGPVKFACTAGKTYQIQVSHYPAVDPNAWGDVFFSIKGCTGPATIDLNPVVRDLLLSNIPCAPTPAPEGTCPGTSVPPLPTPPPV